MKCCSGNACRRGPIHVNIMPRLLLKSIDESPYRLVSTLVHQYLQETGCLLSLNLCSHCQVDEEEAEHVGFCRTFKHSQCVDILYFKSHMKFNENLAGGCHACP